jgi:hypothetical protein
MIFQVISRRELFLEDCTDMAILSGMRLYRDDLTTRIVPEQVIPPVLFLPSTPCRPIKIEAIRE